jgi:20S proteasome alpha/beta subunit
MTPKPVPGNHLPSPNPADWGLGMTICISGISNTGIISVTDSMVSTDEFSADRAAFKLVPIHPDWRVLYAGSLARVMPFCRRATEYLTEKTSDKPCNFLDLEWALRSAWQDELREMIENKYLYRYHMTVEDFVRDGEKSFGSQYQSMKYQIDEVCLDFELLVSGYDILGNPHVLSIRDPGMISHHTAYKFWAIGSGSPAALSHFFSYGGAVFDQDHESMLYRCIASKFAAEVAPGVGKKTLIAIVNSDRTLSATSNRGDEIVRPLWEKYGVPTISEECLTAVKTFLAGLPKKNTRSEARPSDSQTSEGQP